MRLTLSLLLLLTVATGCGATPAPASVRPAEAAGVRAAAVAPAVLAKWREGHSATELGYAVSRTIAPLGVEVVAVPEGETPASVAEALARSGFCLWTDRVRAIPSEKIIAHPERLINWSPANPVKEDQPALAALRVPEAWKTSRGRGVRVAVVDGPLSLDHPALRGQFEATWHVVKQRPELEPGDLFKFHATVTAGIIGAVRGGTLGVAPESRLLGVQVRDAKGYGTEDTLAEGIVWAADQGAKVMTVYGGWIVPDGDRPSRILLAALAYAQAKDALVVTTAGNDRTDLDPARHPIATYPGVVTVASGDASGRRYDRSNRGAAIAVSAPAVSVIAPFPGVFGLAKYLKLTCTSWAAAHVAGVAALVRAKHPDWPAAAVRQRLTESATDLGAPGFDPVYGHGLVDAARAVE